MRVLLLVNSLPNGGLERQLALLATNLPPEWEARVWAMDGGPYESYLRDNGIPVLVRSRRSRFDLLPAYRLLQDILWFKPDVVHSWGWMPALAAGPICRALGIPCIDGMIQSGALEPDFTRLKRIGMATATLVMANTEAGLRAWDIGPDKGRVVYNGFDTARLRGLGERSGPDPERFTVVMTGRMRPVKDFDLIIAAARRLSRHGEDWRFLLVGDGPERPRLIHDAADLVDAGVVVFPSPGLEILDLVRQADVGVLMTNPALAREGLSNSIMEYMALGLPVVCGNGGGNPELVQDGVTGLIIPPADVDALVNSLTLLRREPAVRASMGKLGRERIGREFSVEAMVNAMLSVYEEAAARVRPAARGD